MARSLDQAMEMPDVGDFDYLWQAFIEMGPVQNTAMGSQAWDWSNVEAFARVTGLVDEAWELRLLRRMSASFLAERNSGERIFAMTPLMQVLGDEYDVSEMAPVIRGPFLMLQIPLERLVPDNG